jgi:hypothetical protein
LPRNDALGHFRTEASQTTHSITSSASANNVRDGVIPNRFAVFS